MTKIAVKPGDVVVTNFDFYQHWSLVTDRVCSQGKYMLISATKRNGTVQEESWDTVTQGNQTYVTQVETNKLSNQILSDARAQIGKWSYSVTDRNCEHFVKWSSGLKISSTQVWAGVGGGIAGVAMVGLASKNPNLIKFLGGAILIAGLAVAMTRACEKVSVEYA